MIYTSHHKLYVGFEHCNVIGDIIIIIIVILHYTVFNQCFCTVDLHETYSLFKFVSLFKPIGQNEKTEPLSTNFSQLYQVSGWVYGYKDSKSGLVSLLAKAMHSCGSFLIFLCLCSQGTKKIISFEYGEKWGGKELDFEKTQNGSQMNNIHWMVWTLAWWWTCKDFYNILNMSTWNCWTGVSL